MWVGRTIVTPQQQLGMEFLVDKRSLFDVAARTMGLWQILYGIDDIGYALGVATKLYEPSRTAATNTSYLFMGMVHVIPGLYLLFSASALVKLVYGNARATQEMIPRADVS